MAARLSRGAGNIAAVLASDLGKPTLLTTSWKERIDGFSEEGMALVKAYNTRNGTVTTWDDNCLTV